MKVLVVGASYEDSFAHSIATAFERLGHHVSRFDEYATLLPSGTSGWSMLAGRAVTLFPEIERLAARRLVRQAERFGPDLVLTNYVNIRPSAVRDLRRSTGAVVACWFPDTIVTLGRGYIMAADYDLFFSKDRFLVDLFREKLGHPRSYYLPQACEAQLHRPPDLTEADLRTYGCDITTAGSLYYYRAKIFEQFLDRDIKIWGTIPRWLDSPIRSKHQRRPVYGIEKAKAFRAARIVLNTQLYAEIGGINKRTFEVSACGGFQITDDLPAMGELFEIGREIVTYTNLHDLHEKVDYYLRHPEEREQIRERAVARAHRDHTYENRVAEIVARAEEMRGAGRTLTVPALSQPLLG